MAWLHRPARGNVYEKRRVMGSSLPQPPPSEALTSSEAGSAAQESFVGA